MFPWWIVVHLDCRVQLFKPKNLEIKAEAFDDATLVKILVNSHLNKNAPSTNF